MEGKYLLQEGGRAWLFKDKVKEIKGPLADLLDIHTKAEHHVNSNNKQRVLQDNLISCT